MKPTKPNAVITKRKKAIEESPGVPCPACNTPTQGFHEPLPTADPKWKPAQPGEIDKTMVTDENAISVLRADRMARRAKGNMREELAAQDLAARYRNADSPQGGPEKGLDDCPVCGATDVKVDDAKLTPQGRAKVTRTRARKVQNTIAASADETAARLRKRWVK